MILDLAPLALYKRLDGIVLGRRAVDEIDGVVAALYDGFRQIFGEGSEVATIFVNVIQAFVGHAELRHRLVGSCIRRADENGHAVFCGLQNQFLATLRYVAFLYAKSDHRNHIHFSCMLNSVSCTFILFRSSSDEVGSVSLCGDGTALRLGRELRSLLVGPMFRSASEGTPAALERKLRLL